MASFTPGPWDFFENCMDGLTIVQRSTRRTVGHSSALRNPLRKPRNTDDIERAEAIANGHLIAAAPDMYEAAKDAASYIAAITKALRELGEEKLADLALTDAVYEGERSCERLHVAIVKAEGK